MTDSGEKLENLISRLPFTESQANFSVLHPEYTADDIALSITPANILVALLRAREARDMAVSYRNFNVGAALFALKHKPAGSRFITGANIKPDPESSVNIHAEQSALRRARQSGFTAISILAVVGETQNDTQSGHEMCTLHPCGLCRAVLRESPLVDNDRTLIATALPDLRTIELSTVSTLDRYHDHQEFDVVTQIEVPDLELLMPVATGSPIYLHDSQAMRDEDDIWHTLIDQHVLPFRLPRSA